MRVWGGVAWLSSAIFVACASAPLASPPPAQAVEEHDAAVDVAPTIVSMTDVEAPERSQPPSTKTYDEALSTPEGLDVHDERVHLTDAQLAGPMRGVLTTCRVPSNARVTIKTAVQYGRAIGVTVSVRFERRKSSRSPSMATLRAEAKTAAKIVACADHAVRAVVWPPSSRRDSFTTEL